MANIIMFHQGRGHDYNPLNCGGGPEFTAPTSKRIAAEYHRGFYTLTNVLNPNWDNNWYGRENWQQKLIADVKVGDTIWFVYVPPKHKLIDVAAYGEKTLTDASSLESLSGMELELVVGKVDVDSGKKKSDSKVVAANDATTCNPSGVEVKGTLSFPAGNDPDEIFVQSDIGQITAPKKGLLVGLKVKAYPKGKKDLKDIRAKLAVVAHVISYDSQTHM